MLLSAQVLGKTTVKRTPDEKSPPPKANDAKGYYGWHGGNFDQTWHGDNGNHGYGGYGYPGWHGGKRSEGGEGQVNNEKDEDQKRGLGHRGYYGGYYGHPYGYGGYRGKRAEADEGQVNNEKGEDDKRAPGGYWGYPYGPGNNHPHQTGFQPSFPGVPGAQCFGCRGKRTESQVGIVNGDLKITHLFR